MIKHDYLEDKTFPDEEFLKWTQPPQPSIVKRNKNKKTISVWNAFDMNEIPVKVIASYEKWLEFEKTYLFEGHIEPKGIKGYISRPKEENLEKLKVYYADSPQQFSNFFYNYYIIPANSHNPKNFNSRKHRGIIYGLDRIEMYKIRISATQLYVYLKHWVNEGEPGEKPPPEFVAVNTRDKIHPNMLISTTWELMEKHYGIKLLETEDEKIFYNNYIANQRLLSTYKMAFSRINYAPTKEEDGTIYPAWANPLFEVLETALKTPQKS